MSSLRRHIGVLGQIAGFYLLHFLFFGRHFVDGSAILVGDSQIAISLNNLATYTLNTYHEFLFSSLLGKRLSIVAAEMHVR